MEKIETIHDPIFIEVTHLLYEVNTLTVIIRDAENMCHASISTVLQAYLTGKIQTIPIV